MAGLSSLVALGGHLEIWMLCTMHKYIFMAFLDDPAIVLPPTITHLSKWDFRSFLNSLVGLGIPRRVFLIPNELL